MHLQVSIVLLILLTGGFSLNCYDCPDQKGICTEQRTCSDELSKCGSRTRVQMDSFIKVEYNGTSCVMPHQCESWSLSIGFTRMADSIHCCDSDLCNEQAPDSSSYVPNGNKCYSCDWEDCSHTVGCWGNETYCFTANRTFPSQTRIAKGCASKAVCDGLFELWNSERISVQNLTCCEGSLCNSDQIQ